TFSTSIGMADKLIMGGQDHQLIIYASQIQYSFAHERFENIKEMFNSICDLLMVKNSILDSIITLNIIKDTPSNSMEYTKNKFTSMLDSSVGVGVRELFIYNNNLCEIKIEPYLQDNNFIYIEGRYNFKEILVNNIDFILKQVIDDYNTKCNEINNKL
ncbi:MAG: hypothetical protein ACRDA5_16415, partial [Clostridium sp.]